MMKLQVIAPAPRYPFPDPERTDALPDELKASLRALLGTDPQLPVAQPHRERRATPRVPIELCCEERVGERPYYRTTYDLSTFGLSTQYGHGYPLGTLVALRLHLPDDLGRPLELRAEVVGTHEETAGMRLAFRQPSAEAVRRIHRYLFARDAGVVGHA